MAAFPAAAEFEAGKFAVRTFQWEGLNRVYYVYAPVGYDTSARALVLDFHGFESSAGQQSAISGFKSLADSEGFLAAWPNGSSTDGISTAWNAGICCDNPETNHADDIGFVREVVVRISQEATIDPARIYATGLSNGGGMSLLLACEAADLFAAATSVAFPVPFNPMTLCQPSRPIAVSMVMGLTDIVVPYTPSFFPGAVESFQFWSDTNSCDGETPDFTTPLSAGAACETYSTCNAGVETRLCSVIGSDSVFEESLFGHVLYYNDSGYDVASDSWDFMKRHTLPVAEPAPLPMAIALLLTMGLLFAFRKATHHRLHAPSGLRNASGLFWQATRQRLSIQRISPWPVHRNLSPTSSTTAPRNFSQARPTRSR